jgi:hypothetical protein
MTTFKAMTWNVENLFRPPMGASFTLGANWSSSPSSYLNWNSAVCSVPSASVIISSAPLGYWVVHSFWVFHT